MLHRDRPNVASPTPSILTHSVLERRSATWIAGVAAAARSWIVFLPVLVSVLLGLGASLGVGASPARAEQTEPPKARPAAPTTERPALDPRLFPVPENLEDAVDFWTRVYSQYPSTVVLLHDDRHLGVIYAAVDFSKLEASSLSEPRKRRIRRDEIDDARNKYRVILEHLADGEDSGYDEQARIEALFLQVPGGAEKYRSARDRIRAQRCMSDVFAQAVERSGFYMPEMERIFRQKGLPLELTRLPFVESMFQWNAHSSAAAAGIWQFVASTAKDYLRMEAEYDERYDPLRATDAASRFLADNYAELGTWPLAVTAYNHGRYGMKRAVRKLGTRDLGVIVDDYRSRSFGFASRNFYAEFVAAVRVYADRRTHFPGVEPRAPLDFAELELEHYVPLPDLVAAARFDEDELREMNPALRSEVWRGDLYLPRGYGLKVPREHLGTFREAYASLPESLRARHQMGLRYQVRRGDTLSVIASRFGTSARAIQRANGLASAHRIRIGQTLLIPPRGGARYAMAGARTPAVHVVQRGESLSRIASRYDTTTGVIQQANGLSSPHHIRVGQRLTIPGGAAGRAWAGRATHVVRSGETLAVIARRYGTTVRALQQANRISGHIIQPSQVLIIP